MPLRSMQDGLDIIINLNYKRCIPSFTSPPVKAVIAGNSLELSLGYFVLR